MNNPDDQKDKNPQEALDGDGREPGNYGPERHTGSEKPPKKQSGSMSSSSEPGANIN